MAEIYNIVQKTKHKLALRQYSPEGKYFLITLSKNNGDILNIEEHTDLPENWSKEYINELLENGKVLKSKVLDSNSNSL